MVFKWITECYPQLLEFRLPMTLHQLESSWQIFHFLRLKWNRLKVIPKNMTCFQSQCHLKSKRNHQLVGLSVFYTVARSRNHLLWKQQVRFISHSKNLCFFVLMIARESVSRLNCYWSIIINTYLKVIIAHGAIYKAYFLLSLDFSVKSTIIFERIGFRKGYDFLCEHIFPHNKLNCIKFTWTETKLRRGKANISNRLSTKHISL